MAVAIDEEIDAIKILTDIFACDSALSIRDNSEMAEHNDEIRKFMGKIYRILSVIDDNIIQEIQTFSVLRMGLCLRIRSRKSYPSVFFGWDFVFVSGVVSPMTQTLKPLKS